MTSDPFAAADDLDIAVVGIGCRFPGAHGPDRYWQNLVEGKASIRTLSEAELRQAGVPASEYQDPSYVRAASQLEDVDRFDAAFFGYSPKEAELLDPQIRVFLETAWEALEHAGYDPSAHAAPVGVFVAASPTTYLLTSLRRSFDPTRFTLGPGNLQHYLGNASEFIATRVSYKLNMRGPSLSVQSACSGSLVAVHLARQSLLSGESSLALAGGVSIYLPQDVGYQYRDGLILSPDGACRPFDAQAAGTVFGRGAGVVVLKRLADALADRDHIYAVVKGSAINNDGSNKVGFTAPSVSGQADVIAEALANAGVTADTIGYVEAHGTATAQGDPIEIAGLVQAFDQSTSRRQFCAIGSVKGNIGHLDAAAGMAGLIKTVLSLDRERIPASLHYTRANPVIDFARTPFYVNAALSPWPRSSRPRRAGISAFGMGGTNAHVVVEEGPRTPAPAGAPRDAHVLTLSAKTQEAARELASRYAAHLAHGDVSLADLCFTATTGRAAMAHRVAIVTGSREELVSQLEAIAAGRTAPGVVEGEVRGAGRPRVAFAFTGQGAQYAGMGRELFATQPVFRAALEACAAGLANELDRPLLEVIFGDDGGSIDDTGDAQPALFAIEYALARLWASWGVEPGAVLGHSIGEYAAAVVAGAVPLDDALRLVAARGRLLQALPREGAMTAVLASAETADAAIAGEPGVGLAAINAADAVVMAGPTAGVEAVEARLGAAGVELQRLVVSHAFHSTLVEPMLDAWQAVTARVHWQAPKTPIVSGLTGRVATADELADATYWRRQVREAVQFAAGVATLAEAGYSAVVEVGPQPTLTTLARRGGPGAAMWWGGALRRGRSAWHGVLSGAAELWVRGVPVNWTAVAEGTGARRVALPTYAFQRTRFWIDPPRDGDIRAGARRGFAATVVASPALPHRVVQFDLAHDAPAFLADHRVGGGAVLPFTGFVELVLSAAGGPVEIEAMRVRRALFLPEGERRQVQVIVRTERGVRAFEVHSRRIDSADAADATPPSDAWVLHAEGRIRDHGPEDVGPVDITPMASGAESLTGDAYYAELASLGLAYGPAFRGIETLWHQDAEVLAAVTCAADVVSAAGQFRAHPAIVDVCLQGAYAAFADLRTPDTLFLPVGLDRLRVSGDVRGVRWSRLTVTRGADPDRISIRARLADETGREVALVDGFVMQRVARRVFAAADRFDPEWFYQIEWRPQPLRGDASSLGVFPPAAAAVVPAAEQIEAARTTYGADVYDALEPLLDSVSREYVVEALEALGWRATPGRTFTTAQAVAELGVRPHYHRMLGRMFEMLAEEGLLVRDGEAWREIGFARTAGTPSAADLLARFPTCRAELTVFSRCGAALAPVLRGDRDPLELLFPGGSLADLEGLYATSSFSRAFNALVRQTVESVVAALPAGRTLRVLEVGAGTGGTASWVLPVLASRPAEYTFTDVSPLFLSRARQRFAEFPFVEYRLLDLEREPEAQGIAAGHYDLVLATNVLHATEDLRRTMSRVQRLLVPGGLLVMVEAIAPQRWVDVIFGLTDGWWKFRDDSLRPAYPLLRIPQWRTLLAGLGFEGTTFAPGEERSSALCHQCVVVTNAPGTAVAARDHWAIVRPAHGGEAEAEALAAALAARGATATVVAADVSASREAMAGVVTRAAPTAGAAPRVVSLLALDAARPHTAQDLRAFERRVAGGTLHLTQALLAHPAWEAAPLTIVTRGAQPDGTRQAGDGVDAPALAAQATVWGFGRSVALEHPELACRRVDLDPHVPFDAAQVVAELYADPIEDEVVYRGGGRHVARLAAAPPPVPVSAGHPEPSTLDVETPGLLETLRLRSSARRAPSAHEVEVEVTVGGLNFKDVLIALGVLPRLHALGLECAGRVVRVGDAVTDLAPGDEVVVLAAGSFATFVTVPESTVVRRPASLSAEEAATIPVAFVTAAYAVERVAALKRGERVLIHAATGAVGMAAVQIARRIGAEVFATAGNDEKRAWLRQAGIAHVMDSRSLRFADEIRERTGGRGVDVVLNSLGTEFVRAGLSVLAPGGRFVELGKTALLSHDELAALPADRSYRAIDVTAGFANDPAAFHALLGDVVRACAERSLEPLPRRVFDASAAGDAFRFMAQARHLGKLLVRFGGEQPGGARAIRSDATYLVTGAFGGLGVLVARWLVARGARSLALMGRHAPSDEARTSVDGFAAAGVDVRICTGDVGAFEDVQRVVGEVTAHMAPLAGVFHAAGIVDDGVLLQQDWGRFERVFGAKVYGTWHLHQLTERLPLDHFVLFSTSMAVLGSAGQSNHAAANTFMDALAAARRAKALPAISIGWGPWADVGAAVALNVTARQTAMGLGAIRPADGMAILEALVLGESGGRAHVAVMPMAWPTYLRQSAARGLGRLADVRTAHAAARPSPSASNAGAPADVDRTAAGSVDITGRVAGAPVSEKPLVLMTCVQTIVGRSLGWRGDEAMDADRPLVECGLDSLLAVEVRSLLGTALGRTLPASLLFDYPTLEAITGYLGREVLRTEPWIRADVPAAAVAPADTLSSIEEMDDEEVERLLASRLAGKERS